MVADEPLVEHLYTARGVGLEPLIGYFAHTAFLHRLDCDCALSLRLILALHLLQTLLELDRLGVLRIRVDDRHAIEDILDLVWRYEPLV